MALEAVLVIDFNMVEPFGGGLDRLVVWKSQSGNLRSVEISHFLVD